MDTETILKELSVLKSGMPLPRAALEAAVQQKETIVPILLDRIQAFHTRVQDPDYDTSQDPDSNLLFYSLFLMAEMREKRFFPVLLRFLSLPGDTLHFVLGDILTEDIPSILYSVWDGDLESASAFAANPDMDPYARNAVVGMLVALFRDGSIPREPLLSLLRSVLVTPRSKAESDFLAITVSCVCDAQLHELLEPCRRLYRDGWVDTLFANFPTFLDILLAPEPPVIGTRIIESAADTLSQWTFFRKEVIPSKKSAQGKKQKKQKKSAQPKMPAPPANLPPPDDEDILSWNVGRNDPCPCGSGKKFKKCHMPVRQILLAQRPAGQTRQAEQTEQAEPSDPIAQLQQEIFQLKSDAEMQLNMPEVEALEVVRPYPPLKPHNGIPGLLDLFPEDAVRVDQEAWLGMNLSPSHLMTILSRSSRRQKDAIQHLWTAYQMFQDICTRKGIQTLEDFDRDYQVHYLCREWLFELERLLSETHDSRFRTIEDLLEP